MTLWQDVCFSVRSLRQNPALAATCLIVLALGIGANTAIFSAVKAILLDPLPYREPGRLVALYEAGAFKGDIHDEPAPGNFYDWQRHSKSFEYIAAYGDVDGNLSGQTGRLPEHIEGFSVPGICSGHSASRPPLGVPSRQRMILRKRCAPSS